MRGLIVLVVGDDPARLEAALEIAAAHAALGGATRLHLHDRAVPLLADEPPALATALELGVRVSACQTGVDRGGLRLDRWPSVEADGLVGVLASLGEDRLVVV